MRPGSLSHVAHPWRARVSPHTAHAVSDTADIGPGACAPGAVVTRNQRHVFYDSAA